MYPSRIPKWVHNRIEAICDQIIGSKAMQIKRKSCLKQFLAQVWLESDANGWTIVTRREIRTNFNALEQRWKIAVKGRAMLAYPLDVLPSLIPEFDVEIGQSAKSVKNRKPNRWRFAPERPKGIKKGEIVDITTGNTLSMRHLITSGSKAAKHDLALIPKSQYKLKREEKIWLRLVARGRMHRTFIEGLEHESNAHDYKLRVRCLNQLYNAKLEGDYITYDHAYKLTFGGRYYDRIYQNLPNSLKAKFRTGLINYDIAGCCLAALNTLFKRYGLAYRIDNSLYNIMMERTGLDRKQCKLIVISTINRMGKVTLGIQSGMGENIYLGLGRKKKKARAILKWWKQESLPLRQALEQLVTQIKEQHRKQVSPRQYHLYSNDVGLLINLNDEKYHRKHKQYQDYAENKGLLSHMTMGVEQAYIREVIKLNPKKICMLDHDGFAALGDINFPEHEFITLEIKE